MGAQLTMSHYRLLFSIKNKEEVNYYIDQVSKKCLSKRQLEMLIKSHAYERLPKSTKQKLINKEETKLPDLVPNPIMIRNKNNYEIISEKILMKIIMENIPSFLKELGSGFTFIDNEYKIKVGNNYNYIDLLLFNIEYNCYVVIELKVTGLKKEHIGQIQVYMNYIDNKLKKYYQDKTIGIIVTKKDNKFIMEYCSDPRILNREYEII